MIVADIIDTGGSGTAAMTINLFGLTFFSGLLLRQAPPAAVFMIASFFLALTAFEVLKLADQNLYAAKRQGRNRVVFHREEYAMMQTGIFRNPGASP